MQDKELLQEIRSIRADTRDDFRRVHEKLDENSQAINQKIDDNTEATQKRLNSHSNVLAVLEDREIGRDKRINTRIGLGVLIVAAAGFAAKLIFG